MRHPGGVRSRSLMEVHLKKVGAANARAAKHGMDAMAMATTAPFAAMITLGHRVPMLLEAMSGGSSWNDPEFQRMSTEKVQAAEQASLALNSAVVAGQQAMASYAVAETSANVAFFMRLSPTPAYLQSHAEQSLERFSGLTAALGEIGSRSVASGMRPAHQKVTANAKRLGKKSRQ